jgi:hypothetical protein
MTSDDVLRALRAEQNLATRKLAAEVWRHLFGRTKPASLRNLPISPVEAERMRGVLRTLMVALSVAERAFPSCFHLVPPAPPDPTTEGGAKHVATDDHD